ncbi:hypothetical protein [Mucilaginibacter ginsenosidivorax]|uniref:Uncharacterized protein n=1 Tax=Mucilaginibacter ginsenosidivorax TaxID=862126 RepID=A0A5B8W659_9SPHI|nr:hypothetical protein [Mucilaginibacter ginsenosidivorax]QEC78937.1 hypothetical protein FSB76_24410 [Mucilaginibacter ginsenosidivorax]
MANTQVDFNLIDSLNNYLIVQDYLDEILIMAWDLSLDPLSLPNNKSLTILAYNLTLSDNLALDQKNIFLLVNRLVLNNAPTISTGTDGRPFGGGPKLNDKPCSTVKIGPSGDNFNTALQVYEDAQPDGVMNGRKAGNIVLNVATISGDLTLSAKGGNGGKGQAGADGQVGCDYEFSESIPNRLPGIYRHEAESGGLGAIGGWGGDGGNVTLAFADPQAINQVSLNVSGGQQGDYGNVGQPGQHGGRAYQVFYYGYDHGEPMPVTQPYPPSGPAPVVPNPVNDNLRGGKAGSVFYEESAAYNRYLPVEFGRLLMLKAEALYLNSREDFTECVQLLTYIMQIAPTAGAGLTGNNPDCPSLYLQDYSTDRAAWDALALKAASFLQQIGLGLDIFGHAPNYVPNLTMSFLQTNFAQVSNLIDGFEDFVKDLLNRQENLQLTVASREISVSQYDRLLSGYQDQINSGQTALIQQSQEIEQRLTTTEKLKTDLFFDDQEFRQAVRDASGGCGLPEVIQCVSAIVTVGTAAVGLWGVSVGAFGAVSHIISGISAVADAPELFMTAIGSEGIISGGIKDLRKEIATGEDDINTIKNAYNSIPGVQDPTPKSLLGVDVATFDKSIDKYLNLPAARKYKKDFHDFLDYVEVTNQKRIQLTAGVLKINKLYQDKQAAITEQNKLKGDITHVIGQQMSLSAKQAVTDLYFQTKWDIIRQIYLQNRAMAYLNPASNQIQTYYDTSTRTLLAEVFRKNSEYLLSLSAVQYQRMSNADIQSPYSLSLNPANDKNLVSATFLNSFLAGEDDGLGHRDHILHFNIDTVKLDSHDPTSQKRISDLREVFKYVKNIRVTGVKAVFRLGSAMPGELTFRLTHLGRSTITTQPNFQEPVVFVHQNAIAGPLHTALDTSSTVSSFSTLEINNLLGIEMGTDVAYRSGVSPFASWQLRINESDNPGIDVPAVLTKLQQIDLYFSYYYENA